MGLIKDINKQYLEAVEDYENEINTNEFPDVECYTNLAFLYWAFASEQFEFNIPNNISDEWSIIGGEKFIKILDKGLSKYPNNLELNFWKRYFPYRLFMAAFSEHDCKELLRKYGDGESLVPYFYLYLFDEQEHKSKVDELLEICNNKPTAKNIYIKSFITI